MIITYINITCPNISPIIDEGFKIKTKINFEDVKYEPINIEIIDILENINNINTNQNRKNFYLDKLIDKKIMDMDPINQNYEINLLKESINSNEYKKYYALIKTNKKEDIFFELD